MMSRLLLVLAAAGSLAAPSVATSSEGKTTICHRTGNKAVAGVFRGQIITVGNSGVAKHLEQHGDVEVPEFARGKFSSSRDCGVDEAGNLYDGQGNLVQNPGGGWEDPGPQ